jgi:uncharacterized protein with ATP-grasp and redox domains
MNIVEISFPGDQNLKKELQDLMEDELLIDAVAKEMNKESASVEIFYEL